MVSVLDGNSMFTNIFDTMASAAVLQQSRSSEMASSVLSGAIDHYMAGEYETAAKEFQRAIGLAPNGDNALAATEYLSITYQKLEKPDRAIKAYENAVALNPSRDDIKVKLGNLYYSQERYQEAEEQYADAVRINPSAVNLFSLGNAQMTNGKLNSAMSQFQEVIRFSDGGAQGYYGLGQALAKAERYDEAVDALKQAIDSKRDFHDAYVELGYTYADMGEMERAEEIQDYLSEAAPQYAATLAGHIYQQRAPQFEMALASSSFLYQLAPKTPVAALDSYLQAAGTSQTFNMVFMFDKQMDIDSVTNRFNWEIRRSDFSDPGQRYNNGLPLADTEVTVPAFPENVSYDVDTQLATVTFRVSQLPDAINGTIDPSHLVFQFKGKDTNGNSMDTKGDEYSYASGIR